MSRDKFTVRVTIDYLYCRNVNSSNPLSKQSKLVDMKLYLLQAKARASRLCSLTRALAVRTLRVDNTRHLPYIELGASFVPLK